MGGGHEGWWLFGGGFMWLFWILLIAALVLLFKYIGDAALGNAHGARRGARDEALEILRQRLARGEIDGEAFERLKRELDR